MGGLYCKLQQNYSSYNVMKHPSYSELIEQSYQGRTCLKHRCTRTILVFDKMSPMNNNNKKMVTKIKHLDFTLISWSIISKPRIVEPNPFWFLSLQTQRDLPKSMAKLLVPVLFVEQGALIFFLVFIEHENGLLLYRRCLDSTIAVVHFKCNLEIFHWRQIFINCLSRYHKVIHSRI